MAHHTSEVSQIGAYEKAVPFLERVHEMSSLYTFHLLCTWRGRVRGLRGRRWGGKLVDGLARLVELLLLGLGHADATVAAHLLAACAVRCAQRVSVHGSK